MAYQSELTQLIPEGGTESVNIEELRSLLLLHDVEAKLKSFSAQAVSWSPHCQVNKIGQVGKLHSDPSSHTVWNLMPSGPSTGKSPYIRIGSMTL